MDYSASMPCTAFSERLPGAAGMPANVHPPVRKWRTFGSKWRAMAYHPDPRWRQWVVWPKEDHMLIFSGKPVMSFNEVVHAFSARPACTDAYDELRDACLQLAKTDPENAGTCFLVAGFARAYVLLYDEEAVPAELAQRAQRQMVHYLEMLASSIMDGTASARLSALNAVVLDYLQSDRIF
jgi:hypothetical protein